MLFRRTLLLNNGKLFCGNHIVSEAYLGVSWRNICTAKESMTMRPPYSGLLYLDVRDTDLSVKRLLPNTFPCTDSRACLDRLEKWGLAIEGLL